MVQNFHREKRVPDTGKKGSRRKGATSVRARGWGWHQERKWETWFGSRERKLGRSSPGCRKLVLGGGRGAEGVSRIEKMDDLVGDFTM